MDLLYLLNLDPTGYNSKPLLVFRTIPTFVSTKFENLPSVRVLRFKKYINGQPDTGKWHLRPFYVLSAACFAASLGLLSSLLAGSFKNNRIISATRNKNFTTS
jgi:hypothetical protein